jgi:hypothetical protein
MNKLLADKYNVIIWRRSMKKILFAFSLSALMSSQLVFAAGGALWKFAGDTLFLNQKLATGSAMEYTNRATVRGNLTIAMENFTKKEGGSFNIKDLKAKLRYIRDADDKAMLQKAITTLEKDVDDVTPQEIVNLSNKLAELSDRHGYRNVGILSCTDCSQFSAAKDKIIVKLERISHAGMKHIYKNVLSRHTTPRKALTYINARLKSLDLGRFTNLSKIDRTKLAAFLSIDKFRSSETAGLAGLYDSIIALSTKNGKTDLFDPKDGHKLWKIPSEVKTPEEALLITDLFNVVAVKRQKEGIGTYEALERTLKEAIENEPDTNIKKQLEVAYDKWIKKGCYKK